MQENLFKKIGLTESETKVYNALLEIGDTTRSKIVKESKIAGSKIYDVLEKLQDKGLVSTYLKNKIMHFKPLHPNQIKNYIEEKKEELNKLETEFDKIIPSLIQKYQESKEEQEVELITGMKGLQIFFTEQINTLKKGEYNYVIGGTKGNEEKHVVAFFRKIHKERENKGIKTRMLYNKRQEETVNKSYSEKEYKNTQTKFINHSAPTSINIYKNKTLITLFDKKIIAIQITSQEIANSFKEYFELLWETH